MTYRAEIDGLRALAVLPVILFHAGIAGFGGGFVGVDVFFVISGYLITSIIWSDLEGARFSYRRFYERRARRILPALVAVMLLSAPFAYTWLIPSDFVAFAKSSLAALASLSNFYFWSQSGYFAPAAETQPLLHTWSLGVEEQFYVLFPILLVALHRRFDRKHTMAVLAILTIASLALCEWGWRNAPDANFFLAPFRAWELLLGALCALHLRRHAGYPSDALALSGIGMIVASVALMSEDTPYPSLATLLPVAGTMLVILCAQGGTLAARLLGLKPLVGIGLVSYSAYLVHQPLFAFARARSIEHPSTTTMLVLSLLSLLLAAASWRWIESPFRGRTKHRAAAKGGSVSISIVPRTVAVACCALAILSLAVVGSGGLASRFDRNSLATFAANRAQPLLIDRCKLDYVQVEPLSCGLGVREAATRRIALIGDSHASQWAHALDLAGREHGWQVDTFAKSACPLAFVDFTYKPLRRDYAECGEWRDRLIAHLDEAEYDLVIVAYSGLGYTRYNGKFSVPSGDWREGIERLTARLDGLPGRWAILSDNPHFRGTDPVACIGKTAVMRMASPDSCRELRVEALDGNIRAIEREQAQARAKGHVIDLADQLCDHVSCDPAPGGMLVMSDTHHLSAAGTNYLLPGLIAEIDSILTGRTASRLAVAATD